MCVCVREREREREREWVSEWVCVFILFIYLYLYVSFLCVVCMCLSKQEKKRERKNEEKRKGKKEGRHGEPWEKWWEITRRLDPSQPLNPLFNQTSLFIKGVQYLTPECTKINCNISCRKVTIRQRFFPTPENTDATQAAHLRVKLNHHAVIF